MKRNKFLASALTVSAFALFATTAFAQTSVSTFKKGSPQAAAELKASQSLAANVASGENQDKAERGAKRMEQLQQRLNLTAEQSAKIQTILQNSREKAKAEREKVGTDREAFKAAMKENMRNTNAQIEAVLTAEQVKKYAELKAEMKAKHEKGEGRDHDKKYKD